MRAVCSVSQPDTTVIHHSPTATLENDVYRCLSEVNGLCHAIEAKLQAEYLEDLPQKGLDQCE
jgi:hypothetical protein